MTFKPGEVTNPNGRPVGSENKLNSRIKRRLNSILDKLDDPRLTTAVNNAKPGELLSFIAKIAPKDLNVTVDGKIELEKANIIINGKPKE
jgi:hypothetical protein